jgi:hypothetical protein
MILGCAIGFFAGYIVRYLQDLKEELDEVDGIVKKELGKRSSDHKPQGQDGVISAGDVLRNLALLFVVAVTAWAAFSSAGASSKVAENQREQKVVTDCTKDYLTKTVKALNERTEFTVQQAAANVALQKAQADFFALLLRKPPESVAVRTDAAQTYLKTLQDFVAVSEKTRQKARQFPYPTDQQLNACYHKKGTS